jgi:hypothetical protein
MKFLNRVKQLWTYAGSHERAAIFASGLHQPGVPKTQGVPEYAIF